MPEGAVDRLLAALREHALVIGEVTLTSGAVARYLVDVKRAILLRPGFDALAELVAAQAIAWGATAGFLNEEQLFYLRARGIPQKEAEALLLEAFAAEAIEDVGTEAIRAELTESVGQWLRQRQG